MDETLEAVLDAHVRPLLRAHGGDLEVINTEGGVLRFRFKGKCRGCPAADLTTEAVVQTAVSKHLPQFSQAVLVQDVSPELLEQARALLNRHGA